jgi:hypothetical protein
MNKIKNFAILACVAVSSIIASCVITSTPPVSTGYSKISNSGAVLPDSAVLGTGENDWACTKDNITGLIWEVKTDDDGFRDKDNTFSWYDSNPATNGDDAGYQNKGTCSGVISCDTEGYAQAVNATKLCSFSDWKVPNQNTLISLGNTSINRFLNLAYFPNTETNFTNFTWTSSSFRIEKNEYVAVSVAFMSAYGYSNSAGETKNTKNAVRLVSGQ